MRRDDPPFAPFHPLVRDWFAARIGAPTEVQRLAWPRIAAGRHVLAAAPTGSGKTLAAFLWSLDRLFTGAWVPGATRVLYVSPLRALNNDVRRNLLRPLEELAARFREAGLAADPPRVATRSGDTPPDERRRMIAHPPEILITTPESLNLLLASPAATGLFAGLACVILDEVHAVVESKRGVHLVTAIERLVPLAGEFQRVALSATVRPAERIAAWVGGWELLDAAVGNDEPAYRARPVEVVEGHAVRRYEITVDAPRPAGDAEPAAGSGWRFAADELGAALARNRTTLAFAGSRRGVEKLARLVNDTAGHDAVHAHHGSLSREVREAVERRLAAGDLKGVVATNSLELGIDIGPLDEVLLVTTPPTVAAAVQRIGRAGHAVGGTSRARYLPLFPRDLVEAVASARAVHEGTVEPLAPVEGALDVLAQVVVAMTLGRTVAFEDLFARLRCAAPYHGLTRDRLAQVVEMLAGRHAGRPRAELRALVSYDPVEQTVRARDGARLTLYRGGGVIPDRGLFRLRRAGSGALIGELDEEFVWERRTGDSFTLGVQSWRIERITHNEVLVEPSGTRAALAPFWRADGRDRGAFLSARIGALLEEAEGRLDDPHYAEELARADGLTPGAAAGFVALLTAQRRVTGLLPHARRIVAERVRDAGRDAGETLVLHLPWGGRLTRPLALALRAAWRRAHGLELGVVVDDDALAVSAPAGTTGSALLALLAGADLEDLLRDEVGRTGLLGAAFREAAGAALALPRAGFGRRTPLWVTRQRAKELFDRVHALAEFPLVIEAWRAVLADRFDLPALAARLAALAAGEIAVHDVATLLPSPFAAEVVWRRTNELMYESDEPTAAGLPPSAQVLRDLVHAGALRPRVPRGIVEQLRRKVQRLEPGYAPEGPRELLDVLRERVAVPADAWDELLAAAGGDPQGELARKAARIALGPHEAPRLVAALDAVPRIAAALGRAPSGLVLHPLGDGVEPAALARAAAKGAVPAEGDPLAELLADVLRFTGPVAPAALAALFGLGDDVLRDALESLVDARRAVVDFVTEEATEPEVCDASHLERLLRALRTSRRAAVEPLPASRYPAFLAAWQRLHAPAAGQEGVREALDRLTGLPLAAAAVERDVLPARVAGYDGAWLDALLAAGEFEWYGVGEERVAFAAPCDRELFAPPPRAARAGDELALPPYGARVTLEALAAGGLTSAEAARRLWRAAWDGRATCDTFAALRAGLAAGFAPRVPEAAPAGGRRLRFAAWRASRPFGGAWRALAPLDEQGDPIERDELDKDRARALLRRYGVVFRDVLGHEAPPGSWGRVVRALRLLELAGEAVGGQFVLGVSGLQFALPEAIERLHDAAATPVLVGALEPASACGLGIEGLPDLLPRRVATSSCVIAAGAVVLAALRDGRELRLGAPPDDPRVLAALPLLARLAGRRGGALVIDRIDGTRAADHPLAARLAEHFRATRDAGSLRLLR